MICKINCFIAIVFIVANIWFHINISFYDESKQAYVDLLTKEQQHLYKKIIKEKCQDNIPLVSDNMDGKTKNKKKVEEKSKNIDTLQAKLKEETEDIVFALGEGSTSSLACLHMGFDLGQPQKPCAYFMFLPTLLTKEEQNYLERFIKYFGGQIAESKRYDEMK